MSVKEAREKAEAVAAVLNKVAEKLRWYEADLKKAEEPVEVKEAMNVRHEKELRVMACNFKLLEVAKEEGGFIDTQAATRNQGKG